MGSTLSESGASGKAGAVHYRLGDKPMFIQCCHCRNCQKQSGGPFVINGMIERDRIEITAGAPEAPPSGPAPKGRVNAL
jgi:hypothetical protein